MLQCTLQDLEGLSLRLRLLQRKVCAMILKNLLNDRQQKQLLALLPIAVAIAQYFGFTEPKTEDFESSRDAQYTCCTFMHEEKDNNVKLQTKVRLLEEDLRTCSPEPAR